MIKHRGGCHCGRVRFEIVAPARIKASQCNCSICGKSGYLGIAVPTDKFKLLQGADCLTTYRFNTDVAGHTFCRYCGIKSFYTPRSHPHGYNVNARCLDPGTIEHLEVIPFDGANWEKHYPEGCTDRYVNYPDS